MKIRPPVARRPFYIRGNQGQATFLARFPLGRRACNREMKLLMLRRAFRFVDRMVFLVGPQNLRSRRAMEKTGAMPVGTRPDAGGRDSLMYEITSRAFAQRELS